jgi:cytochrome c oxidase cbb3-type subunit 3
MADMPTDFWAGWIATLTIVSLAGLAWLVFSIYFSPADVEHEGDGPVWDETLREGSNPPPMWWFWLILSMMVVSVLYLMLYPGLGSYAGALKWSQSMRLQESQAAYKTEFGGTRQLIAEAQITTLIADDSLMASAQRVFNQNCAVCHGYDAAGQAAHFPNLTDAEWQWGGSPEQIEQSIRHGRTAAMISWSAFLGDDGVVQMADFVRKMGTAAAAGHPSKAQYDQLCIGCHGADGGGNPLVGAPNLVDDIWLYGSDVVNVQKSIAEGRQGEMPAFGKRLDDTQIRLLIALIVRKSTPAAD